MRNLALYGLLSQRPDSQSTAILEQDFNYPESKQNEEEKESAESNFDEG